MELRTFIGTTLQEIVEGVRDAQKNDSIGSHVAPGSLGHMQYPPDFGLLHDRSGALTAVKFDVAVTTESEDKVGAGAGIKIAVVSIGGSGHTTEKGSSLTRIQFSVPVRIPPGNKTAP